MRWSSGSEVLWCCWSPHPWSTAAPQWMCCCCLSSPRALQPSWARLLLCSSVCLLRAYMCVRRAVCVDLGLQGSLCLRRGLRPRRADLWVVMETARATSWILGPSCNGAKGSGVELMTEVETREEAKPLICFHGIILRSTVFIPVSDFQPPWHVLKIDQILQFFFLLIVGSLSSGLN